MPSATLPRRPRKRTEAVKLDRARAERQASEGLNCAEIARAQGVHESTVWRYLDSLKPQQAALSAYKAQRADQFAQLGAKAVHGLHLVVDSMRADLERGGLLHLTKNGDAVLLPLTPNTKKQYADALNIVHGTVYDKERLERGESTANVSVMSKMVDARVAALHTPKPLAPSGRAPLADPPESERGEPGGTGGAAAP